MIQYRITMGSFFRVLLILATVSMLSDLHAQERSWPTLEQDCGSLENGYGPYDYTDPTDVREKLPIVERFHFNVDVESLKRGQSAELPGGDLDYTLRAFPNHHRALYAMARYQLKYPHSRLAPGAQYSGDCYFERAIHFRPEDSRVQLVYGIYLDKRGNQAGAIERFRRAVELSPDSAEAHYNLGLLLFKSGEYVSAREHAQIAYDLGFPLQGLKRRLKEKNQW